MPLKTLSKAFLSGIFLNSFLAHAQMFPTNKGFAVNFSGDTLQGEIIIQNSYLVKYKPSGGQEYVILNPNEINVVVKGKDEYYRSEELPLLGNNNKVFIRELISGDVAFYEFTDSNSVESYYVKKGDDKFRKLNTANYNSIKKALFLNCDSIPEKTKNYTSDYRFNIVAEQISMHNASCSSTENPFKIKYSKKRSTKFVANLGLGSQFVSMSKYFGPSYTVYTMSIGFGSYFPITKNFIVTPEANFNVSFATQSVVYSQPPPIYLDLMPLALMYRTNKFKINPNLFAGLLWKFPIINGANAYSFVVGVGADTEIVKGHFLRFQVRYFNINSVKNTDESIYVYYATHVTGLQFVLSVIF